MVRCNSLSVRLVVGLGALALLAGACQPRWTAGDTVVSNGLELSWPTAKELDDNQSIAGYLVAIDGVPSSVVPAPTTACTLEGLTPSTTHDIEVTAYDTVGEWSGSLTKPTPPGRLTTQVTAPAGPPPAGTPACAGGGADTDGDRLPDSVETNTGTFVSPLDTGTNPLVADTDGDAISDGDEVLGSTAGLDLPSLGVSAVRADILLEYDWFDDSLDCGAHGHQPTLGAITRFTDAFSAAPTSNPDGSTGITVINDYGQGGPFTGGNLVPDANGVIAGGVNGTEFGTIKTANFAPERNDYFHYVLLPHRYNNTSSSSGQAELPGDDLIVSLYCANSDNNVANTIMHELGHNLNLRHGGFENLNHKPNYNSVMNYRYQFPGVDNDCTVPGNGVLDFSRGVRITLDENDLDEGAGICNGVDVDWNGNTVIETGVVADINDLDGLFGVLADSNDWASVSYSGVGNADGARAAEPEVITEQPVPPEFGG